MTQDTSTVEEIATLFRVQFDELGLKPPKGKSMHGLERELIVDYWRKALTTYGNARYEEGVKAERERIVDENTSDGYHTFKELYEFRKLYNAALFNEWARQQKYDVHKSQRHYDGELCFGRDDYFVVVATLPTGQISNHYPMSDWDLFKCEAVEKAKAQWDGHTSQDVAERLLAHISDK